MSALRERTEALGPLISQQAAINEELGELSIATLSALSDAGLFKIMSPEFVDGPGATPLEALEIIEKVCSFDASTGWVLMASGMCVGATAAYLPSTGSEKIFGNSSPIIAGQGAPNGKAVIDGSNFRVSGKWSYGSGLKHADFALAGALVFRGEELCRDQFGRPETRICIIPQQNVVLENNWDVIGLRATGSVDYSITDVIIPADFTFPTRVNSSARGGPFYRLGLVGMAALCHSAFALGVGRRVLAELTSISFQKVGPTGKLCDSESFQEQYAAAEARYQAARLLVMDTWASAQMSLQQDRSLTVREITMLRLALNHITSIVLDICFFAYKAAGGISLRAGPLQRYFRDMSAGAQHLQVSNGMLRDCGRELLGLAPNCEWATTGLVKRPDSAA